MRLPFLLTTFLLWSCLQAQTPFISDKSLGSGTEYTIENWNSENGLPQNSIVSMVQTHDGFLWMSTTNGLVRFDGKTLNTYNSSDTRGLTGNSFSRIFEDSKGVLWLINIDGDLIRYEQGVFATIDQKGGEHLHFHALCENEEGNLILAGADNKIYQFSKGKFKSLVTLPSAVKGTWHLAFTESTLFIGTEKGVFQYRNHLLNPVHGLQDSSVTLMKQFQGEGLWVCVNNHFYRIQNGICSRMKLAESLEAEKNFRDFFIDPDKRLWVSCKSGLAVSDENTCHFYGTREGLSSELTTVIYPDKQQNVWVGTSDAGLNKLKLKTFRNYSKKEGMMADPTGCLLRMKDHSILVSNYCDGLNLLDKEHIHAFTKEHLGCIWALLEDRESTLWVGIYGDGLYRYKGGKWTNYTVKNNLPSNVIFSLFEDKDGVLWIGTNNGICIWKEEKFTPFLPERINGIVTHITQDRQGRIWFCSNKGLGEVESGGVKMFTTASGLSSNSVRYIHEDSEGIFWIATYGGGIHRLKNGQIFAFNKLEGLIDDYTSCILEDGNGFFWISSNRGIYSVKKEELNQYADGRSSCFSRSYFGQEEGLKNSECNGGFQPSGLKTPEGEIWFPTIVGVVVADIRNRPPSRFIPEVFIQKITEDDKSPEQKDSLLRIRRDSKKVEFHFTAPFFGGEHNLFFQYRLEGRDKNWSTPTESRQAEYFDLQPGDYSFHVRVYGIPASAEKCVLLTIPYPFWRTWTAYFLYFFGINAFVFGYIFLHTRTIRAREAEKTRINKTYAALELKALQGQMNPHFTFNCLNTIKYFIAADDKVSANKYLGKFSKLIRLFLEHSSSNFISLEAEINLLTLYIELEQLRLDPDFEFLLSVDPILNLSQIEVPGMLLQPFVENAIHHGLRNSTLKRTLSLIFRKEEDRLVIIVEDNGVGRKKASELKSNSVSGQTSMGIKNTEERIRTINYIKNTDIEMEVSDLESPGGEAAGTRVTVYVPFTEKQHTHD